MKKSTKILLALFLLTSIPAVILGKSVFDAIVPNNGGFNFNFSVKSIIGLCLIVASMILGFILYIRFLHTLSLDKVLFFASLPLFVIYGTLIFLIASIGDMNGEFATTIKSLLNITDTAGYNTILWAVLITIVFVGVLLLNYVVICRPLTKVERIVLRLGDGLVKEDRLFVGKGKQFEIIEHGLNKINANYKQKEYSLKDVEFSSSPLPKHFYKFLGKGNIERLKKGEVVKQSAMVMGVFLSSKNDSRSLSLEENYELVNSYLNIIIPVIRKFDGYIDKFTGESIIGIFSKTSDAVKCGSYISKVIEAKNSSKNGKPLIDYHIIIGGFDLSYGLEKGETATYPVIINPLKDDLEKLNEIAIYVGSQILYTKSCIERLPLDSRMMYRYIGFITLSRGQDVLYEDLSCKPRSEIKYYMRTKRQFEKAVIAFNQGQFEMAKDLFATILRVLPRDKASFEYFGKCKEKLDV